MPQSRILIASNPRALASFVRWLDPDYDVLAVTSLDQARQLLEVESGIALFLIGAHFDDSQALELINVIRSKEQYLTTPLIVVRTMHSEYADMLKQTFTVMKTVKGITEYLDFDSEKEAGPTVTEAITRALKVANMEHLLDA